MTSVASRIAFIDTLTRTNRKLRTLFDARVKMHGLTLARARLLMHLVKADGATQIELANALEVEQSSMVGLIDGLEKKGFVTRQIVGGDRRARGIFLTPVARAETDAILAYAGELREQVLEGVDEADLQTVNRVLQHVARNIDAAS